MRLVLFDIDGTLITDSGAARDAFDAALREVYDYRGDLAAYDFSGRTDPQIAFMVLRDAGFTDDAITSLLPALWNSYLGGLSRNATRDKVRALAGIPELVDALEAADDVVLALLTGNLEAGARLKLEPADLNRYFAFGAFGSDSPDRELLPPVAVERALAAHGHHFKARDVVIIGDSIYDVRCGVPYGATTVAVASGRTPIDALRAESPAYLFESAEDLDGLMAAIVGE